MPNVRHFGGEGVSPVGHDGRRSFGNQQCEAVVCMTIGKSRGSEERVRAENHGRIWKNEETLKN